jgi:hypothetical protein
MTDLFFTCVYLIDVRKYPYTGGFHTFLFKQTLKYDLGFIFQNAIERQKRDGLC